MNKISGKPLNKKLNRYSKSVVFDQHWLNKFIDSSAVAAKTQIGSADANIEDSIDERNSAWIELNFKSLRLQYGKDVEASKVYHYSDIVNRVTRTQSKSQLDSMPELPQLVHLTEPILYSKVAKAKANDNISYSEEIAGSVKTVYSSSDSDDRYNDFMNEDEMIQKVSLFLSEVSIHSGTDKCMLNSSLHNHTHSFLVDNNDTFESGLGK